VEQATPTTPTPTTPTPNNHNHNHNHNLPNLASPPPLMTMEQMMVMQTQLMQSMAQVITVMQQN
jgi:hypothetical protein